MRHTRCGQRGGSGGRGIRFRRRRGCLSRCLRRSCRAVRRLCAGLADTATAFHVARRVHVDFVRLREAVGRQRHVGGLQRLHQVRRDQEDQLGAILLERRAAEQRAEHRHLTHARERLQRARHVVLDQPADRERFAVAHLHRRRCAPRRDQRQDRRAADVGRAQRDTRLRQLRHFRRHLQADPAVGEHGRRELQRDAELLFLQRDRRRAVAAALRDRDEDLAAGEERRFLAADRHEIRLREDLDQVVGVLRVGREVERLVVRLAERDAARDAREQVGDQRPAPRTEPALDVERAAHLVHQRLRHLGHLHLEHHLLRRRDGQHVQHAAAALLAARGRVAGAVAVGARDLHGLLCGLRARHGARQHDRAGRGRHADVALGRHQLLQRRLQAAGIRADCHIDHAARTALALHDHVRRADREPEDVQRLRRHHRGLRDGRIADRPVTDRLRHRHQQRLAERHADAGRFAHGADAVRPAQRPCRRGGRGGRHRRHADRHLHRPLADRGRHAGAALRQRRRLDAFLRECAINREPSRTKDRGHHRAPCDACAQRAGIRALRFDLHFV
ncbi:hypothetical protein L810_0878 [Burkholderia sp. AU4i]|nr:hypothetical protein L810_0878 [Burkholderia sp. AU4i]